MKSNIGRWVVPGILVMSGISVVEPISALPQTPNVVPATSIKSEQVLLNRPVSIEAVNIPLVDALQQFQKQSGMRLIYSDDELVGKRVSVSVNALQPMEALRKILSGTGLKIKTGDDGRVLIWNDKEAKGRQQNQGQSAGVIIGQVVDGDSQKPIPLANVSVSGVRRNNVTNSQGRYMIGNIPPGKYVISARLLGYNVIEKSVTISSGDTVTVDFVLNLVPERLRNVVTTGAGDRAQYEVGNTSTTIKAEEIMENTPIKDLSDLLRGRVPGGVLLSSGGTVGSSSRIRIRGISSVLSNSDPIVIVDGVRLDAMQSQTPTGNANTNFSVVQNQLNSRVAATSRLNDIDPEMIESIEVLKGPSASTLYGSDAANGVIVIRTRRGRPGPTRWNLSTNQGVSNLKAKFNDAWTGWGTSALNPNLANCTLALEAALLCTQDSVTSYNPLNFKESSPFGTGYSAKYSADVSGGTPQVQYFLGATLNNEQGMLKLPDSERARLNIIRNNAPLPSWATRPNMLKSTSVTTNLNTQATEKIDIGVRGSFLSQYHRDAGQGVTGYIADAFVSAGYKDTIGQGWDLRGPGKNFLQRNSDAVKRFSSGVNISARPAVWASVTGVIGIDYSARRDETLLRAEDVLSSLLATSQGGSTQSTRGRSDIENMTKTANVTTTLTLPLISRTRLRSSLGMQYNRSDNNGITSTVSGLAAGQDLVNGATTVGPPRETRSASATVGWFMDEAFTINERLFITTALRGDAGSAFGRNSRAMLYPKFNSSWLISQEPFFPKSNTVSNLRLRGAFGQAGVQPGVEARFRSYQAWTSYPEGVAVPGINVMSLGNANLVPERSVEFEGGFDLGLWDDRLTFDVTNYYKFTKNALITRTLPPSMGLASRQENIGEVSNKGTEISATIRPILTEKVDLSVSLGYSRNSNKLVKLGTDSLPSSTPSSNRFVEGYPLNGFWGRPIKGYVDVDGDGILLESEVQLADSAVYVGQPLPKGDLSMNATLGLLNGRVTVSSMFTYQDGMTQMNQALRSQCGSGRCRMTVDRTSSLKDQAIGLSMSGTLASYYASYETVSWLRWNSLSVSAKAPKSIERIMRTNSASVALMGRNLWLYSKYRGADPEVNTANTGNHIGDSGGVPQTRDWSIRINLSY